MTDLDLGGSLDGWDDELDDWTGEPHDWTDVCIRPRPNGSAACTQGYDHSGTCDWVKATLAGVHLVDADDDGQAHFVIHTHDQAQS